MIIGDPMPNQKIWKLGGKTVKREQVRSWSSFSFQQPPSPLPFPHSVTTFQRLPSKMSNVVYLVTVSPSAPSLFARNFIRRERDVSDSLAFCFRFFSRFREPNDPMEWASTLSCLFSNRVLSIISSQPCGIPRELLSFRHSRNR